MTFAELLDDVLNAYGRTPGEVSRALLDRYGLRVHRSTIDHWRKGDHTPGPTMLEQLRRLPAAIGLSRAEQTAFLAAAGRALGFEIRSPGSSPKPVAIARRLHHGTEHPLPFAGRDDELAALQRLVRVGQSVVITGMGGVGKTRLAQALLQSAGPDFTHGCETLELSADWDATQVIRRAAERLGVAPPPDARDPDNDHHRHALNRLREQLADVRLLFLLDDVCRAEQVRALVSALPGITWVLTSRRAGLARIGVRAFPLKSPPPDAAAAVFRAYLDHVPIPDRDDPAPTRAVVVRLGSLPIALRYAAALPANGIVPTIAALDEWLARTGLDTGRILLGKLEPLFDGMLAELPSDARRLLTICGVFAASRIGASHLRAVCHEAGIHPSPDDWTALGDMSLVDYPDDDHLELHPLLYRHVQRRLRVGPDYPAAQEGFLAHYLSLAERVAAVPHARRDYRLLLAEEAGLLRTAEAFYYQRDWPRLRRIWPAVSGYLWKFARYADYETFDTRCLEAARATDDDEWAAVLLSELGYARKEAGEWDAAEALFRQSQALYDAAPDQTLARARLRRYRAEAALGRAEFDRALALLTEAEALLTQATDETAEDRELGTMLLHSARMTVLHRRGDLTGAEIAGRAADRLHRRRSAVGVRNFGAFRVELGDVLVHQGRLDEAVELWEEAATPDDGLPLLPEHADARLRLAWAYAARGERDRAEEAARVAAEVYSRYGPASHRARADGLTDALASGAVLPSFAALTAD